MNSVFVLAFAALANAPAAAQPQAKVRIVRAAVASKVAWDTQPESRRRESFTRDSHGRVTLVRIIEHE